MNWPLRSYIDSSSWSGVAAGIVFFIGVMAVVGWFFGSVDSFLSESLLNLGAVSVVVVVGTVGSSAITARRRRARATSSTDDGFANPDDGVPLILYQAEGCPYCRRVRRVCTDLGISLVIHNPRTSGTFLTSGSVTNDRRYEELVGHGQDQIPLLVDAARDEVVYESDDIIEYLYDHYG